MNVFVYRLSYFVIALLTILYSYTNVRIMCFSNSRSTIKTLIFTSVFIALFAALRPLESHDTAAYYYVYTKVGSPIEYVSSLFKIGYRSYFSKIYMETGFIMLTSIVKSLFGNFRVFLFITALINAFLINYAIYINLEGKGGRAESKKITAMFFAFFGFLYCCIAIRAGTSLGLCMISFYYMVRKKNIKALIMLLIASRFQNSALIFVIVLATVYITQKKLVKLVNANTICICLIICFISLLLNGGSVIIDLVSELMTAILDRYNVVGFSRYLASSGLDKHVGLKDWLVFFSFGAVLMCASRNKSDTIVANRVVLCGLFITSFLYPIRSINRLADFFYCLLTVVIGKYKFVRGNDIRDIYIKYIFLPLMLLIQFAYTTSKGLYIFG